MPLEMISTAQVPTAKRAGKIEKSNLWCELVETLDKGLPAGKTLHVTFEDAKSLFKNDEAKAAQAFTLKLRSTYGDRYRVRLLAGREVYVSASKEKK